MSAKSSSIIMMQQPIVSKAHCSLSDTVFIIRTRPNVASGGGFAVLDNTSNQRVVFKVDGCGVIGKKGELILRDGEGNELLLIRKKGSIVEALSFTRQWKGFGYDYLGLPNKLVFTVKEPNSCFLSNVPIKISLERSECCNNNYDDSNFLIKGDFPGRNCSIANSRGDAIAQIGVERTMGSRDVYYVRVKAGVDQAFVFGVISVLDYIYDGSTRC